MSAEPFARLADALDYVRDAASLGPGARHNLRRAAAELRDMPAVIAERDRLRAELAAVRASHGVPFMPPRERAEA